MKTAVRTVLGTLLLGSMALLAGCNMVRGLGEDISGSAEYVQEQMFY